MHMLATTMRAISGYPLACIDWNYTVVDCNLVFTWSAMCFWRN